MSDSQARIDWLNTLHTQSEVAKQIAAGAQLVTIGGLEGIKVVAETQPELILEVIDMLSAVILQQNKQVTDIVEMYLESADVVSSVVQSLKLD